VAADSPARRACRARERRVSPGGAKPFLRNKVSRRSLAKRPFLQEFSTEGTLTA
jgi:hypothetical protein